MGRLEKNSVYVDTAEQAYTRYEYPSNGVHSKVYSTITDTNSNGPDAADEVLSETWTDGLGGIRYARTPHTFSSGSPATWAGVATEYDILGRVTHRSVPVEVDGSWQLTGEDAIRGWLYDIFVYDWMGRTIRKIHSDQTDVFFSYEGCGCAGGLVTTIRGEYATAYNVAGTLTEGRKTQKVYEDILGRTKKVEQWDLDGSGTDPYSTVVNTFNGRDQVTLSRQYAGSDSSGTYQDTTMTYDGHGRLKTSHRPEQMDEEEDPTYTTYNYNADDSISSVVDARGAATVNTYNSLGLIEEISWTVPGGSSIEVPDDVTFTYDDLGNRTSMTDGLGSVTYTYNSLSQLTSEKRVFSDTLAHKPVGDYNLSYEYTMSGKLKSYTDPFGDEIEYSHDKLGRLDSVTGSSYGGITTYASNPGYRAWGGLKQLEYGNGVEMSMTYNDKLQVDHFELVKDTTEIMKKNYEYYGDGRLKYTEDELNPVFDRLQRYDHLGRIKEGKSGAEARGGTVDTEDMNTQLPYRQSYTFNAFNNMTQRNNKHWGKDSWYDQNNNLSHTYANNRVTGWQYDADGRATLSYESNRTFYSEYDARGQLIKFNTTFSVWNTYDQNIVSRYYNGDGREEKRQVTIFAEDLEMTEPPYGTWTINDPTYYIRSSVLGGAVISEVGTTGKKVKTFVYGAGAKIATQTEHTYQSTTYKNVSFDLSDASGMSYRSASSTGYVNIADGSYDGAPAETDPMGGNAGIITPYVEILPELPEPEPVFPYFPMEDHSPMMVNGMQVPCILDGMTVPCSMAFGMLSSGSAQPVNTQDNMYLLRQAGIFGYWEDRRGASSSDPNGRIFVQTITEFIVLSDTSNWMPQRQTNNVGGTNREKVKRDEAIKIINPLLTEALKLIKSNKTCQNALSGAYNAYDQFKSALENNKVVVKENEFDPSRPNTLAATYSANPTSNGEITFYKPFFGSLINFKVGDRWAQGLLTLDQIRLLIVLHEIAHLTRRYWHSEQNPGAFGPIEYLNEAEMNRRIYEACLRQEPHPVPGHLNAFELE